MTRMRLSGRRRVPLPVYLLALFSEPLDEGDNAGEVFPALVHTGWRSSACPSPSAQRSFAHSGCATAAASIALGASSRSPSGGGCLITSQLVEFVMSKALSETASSASSPR